MPGLRLGLGPGLVGQSGGAALSAEALALFAAVPTLAPTFARKTAVNNVFVALKTDPSSVGSTILSRLDRLFLFKGADSASGLVDWVNPARTAVNNGMSFATDAGFTGNGTSSYIDSGFNPTTAPGAKYTQDSACAFAWCDTSADNSGPIFGHLADAANRTFIFPRNSGNADIRLNVSGDVLISNADGKGFYLGSRTSSSNLDGYKNYTAGTSNATASAALVNTDLVFGTRNNAAFFSGIILAGGFGSKLTAAEERVVYDAIGTYLISFGSATLFAPSPTLVWYAEGDSITFGFGDTLGGYPGVLNTGNAATYHRRVAVFNNAVTGSAIQDGGATARLTDRAATLDAKLLNRLSGQKYLLSVLIGANDFAAGVSTSTFMTQLTNYLDARRTAGWDKIVVCTNTPSTSPGFEAWRVVVSPLIRALVPAHADAYCDFAADPVMGPLAAASDASLYVSPHPTNLGATNLEAIIRPTIFSFIP